MVAFLHLSCIISVPIWNPFEERIQEKLGKCHPKKHEQIDHRIAQNFTPKRCQNDPGFYIKTHRDSMQKQVAGNMKNIMKKHLFLKGSNLDFELRKLYRCSKTSFAGFRAR